ncbi:hypothetical protein F4678DRAFT_461640 [Xylaria arbuscula]|nr:hypothetical protein F4678DRAFT_461640 [Xylaria arbuscula]
MTVIKPDAATLTVAATVTVILILLQLVGTASDLGLKLQPAVKLTDDILPPGLKNTPPNVAAAGASADFQCPPPPYTRYPSHHRPQDSQNEKSVPQDKETVEDTLHFLNHAHDSINSLSLRYGVPASALRRANNISSDHLIAGRRTVIIPGQYYKGGVSLSPRPIEGEEEEKRKARIRRWMMACKEHEYEVAVLYLEQAGYDVQLATDTYFADEEWERLHDGAGRAKNRRLTPR